ncbi:MAG: GTPase ObgE [Bdellovibrionales bacterium]|nr:GTPase ObgE [Bdellovibrionales bacterium]
MKFVDEVVIDVRSGNGGPGSVHFMRQKYMPKMGPDGGDGGRGGHLYFEATHDMQSLLDFKFKPKYEAADGEGGSGADCNGRDGLDLTVRVPVGTTLRDADTEEFLADLVEPGARVLVLRGGQGGLGNMNFATPTRQAPDFAQPGRPGKSRSIRLELKLLADVGLVGFPNAGKSTLISRLSAARPKIADYPFTTLVPNLGVVRGKSRDFVIADIPGIIEGASEGRGLGIQFLKHCERTRALVIMLDLDPSTGRDFPTEYNILLNEMGSFSEELLNKPRIVCVNKIDAFGTDAQDPMLELFLKEKGFDVLQKRFKKEGTPHFFISAVTGSGLEPVTMALENMLNEMGPRAFKNEISQAVNLGDESLFEETIV